MHGYYCSQYTNNPLELICNMLFKTIKYGMLIIKPLKSLKNYNHCRADSDY